MIKKLILNNVKNFVGKHEFDFTVKNIKKGQLQINNGILKKGTNNLMLTPIFLGANATGKTTILKSLEYSSLREDQFFTMIKQEVKKDRKSHSISSIITLITRDLIYRNIDILQMGIYFYNIFINKFKKETKKWKKFVNTKEFKTKYENIIYKNLINFKLEDLNDFYKLQELIFDQISKKINELWFYNSHTHSFNYDIKNLLDCSDISEKDKKFYKKLINFEKMNEKTVYDLLKLLQKEWKFLVLSFADKINEKIFGENKNSYIKIEWSEEKKFKIMDNNYIINILRKVSEDNIIWPPFVKYFYELYKLRKTNITIDKLEKFYEHLSKNISQWNTPIANQYIEHIKDEDYKEIGEAGPSNSYINEKHLSNKISNWRELKEKLICLFDQNVEDANTPILDLDDKSFLKFKNGEKGSLKELSSGTKKMLSIIEKIISKIKWENEYMVIDEIENGLNYGLIQTIVEIAKEYKVQTFMSSHNPILVENNLVSPLNAFIAADGTFKKVRNLIDKKPNRPETLKSLFSSRKFFNPYFWNTITTSNSNLKTLSNNKMNIAINEINKMINS